MGQSKQFMVADVGGTKVFLYLVEMQQQKVEVVAKRKFFCKDYGAFEEILRDFHQQAEILLVGAAGVIEGERCALTNLSWVIDGRRIRKEFSFKKVKIVNDIELVGKGIPLLEKEDVLVLQKGEEKQGFAKSILSVGTGLGEALVLEEKVIATEGGHCDFAPNTAEEFAFLQKMQQKFGHVSFERVLSGEGVENIYQFFTGEEKNAREIFAGDDGLKSVAFFLKNLGKEGGNLVLKTLSLGGLYLSGGVLEKNFLALQRKEFLEGFLDKGRFTNLLQGVPVSLIKGDKALLLGARTLLLDL